MIYQAMKVFHDINFWKEAIVHHSRYLGVQLPYSKIINILDNIQQFDINAAINTYHSIYLGNARLPKVLLPKSNRNEDIKENSIKKVPPQYYQFKGKIQRLCKMLLLLTICNTRQKQEDLDV
ncbi:hypothetical protein PVA44_07465 (plasmid) [Entomospira nematocerorum]|uniref:Uncharacterized protein n=1 Tax=Entomospira nematocerorum TaxID=2719987 RepID=A0A968KUX6_9SPIO|nr:hypothetical protein [Entomospira nematocera]NIZ47749.1 hypothetical protein [Entomospira nematocera]WDI34703.1 hypothetical protein PVA44_07465 [Entomospira nematocera]